MSNGEQRLKKEVVKQAEAVVMAAAVAEQEGQGEMGRRLNMTTLATEQAPDLASSQPLTMVWMKLL